MWSAICGVAFGVVLATACFGSEEVGGGQAENPVIWADVPDPSVIRVGDTYYMSSTTMHMVPGVPIMSSKNLVDWKLVGYASARLVDNEAMRLEGGRNAYGAGSWASSLRYHEGTFYVATFSATSGRTHIYSTKDVEKGPWVERSFSPSFHDCSLFFDDDGRVYLVFGAGNITLVELEPDLTGVKEGGVNKVIVPNASTVAGGTVGLPAEGSHMRKIDGRYYLTTITWPRGGMRTALVHRADSIEGPYEGRVALADRGIAQGGLIDTPEGRWFAFLFGDRGAVGRIPYLVPVQWEDGWPVFGVEGKVPESLPIESDESGGAGLVTSDEFDRKEGEADFGLAWQWNHLPDERFWSLKDRPGYLRLTAGRVEPSFTQTRNMLTQRTYGPTCEGVVKLDVGGMKDGTAGLALLQRHYGFVGVKVEGDARTLVMVLDGEEERVVAKVPLSATTVYLRAQCEFRGQADRAVFAYSLDGEAWETIGEPLAMRYTLPHFMGYRFALFHQGAETGGFADFDFFRTGPGGWGEDFEVRGERSTM